MDDYNEMMDQYEKDRLEQTHTWISKDAVLDELDTLMQSYDDPVATRIIRSAAEILIRLPAHRFSLMDEVKHEK